MTHNMSLQNLIVKLNKKTKFKKAFSEKNLAFEIAQMIVESRSIKGYTQLQLAKKMKTHQSSIARAEKGKYLPSLSFLEKMANAYKTNLLPPRFSFMSNEDYSFMSLVNRDIYKTEAENKYKTVSDKDTFPIYSQIITSQKDTVHEECFRMDGEIAHA